MKTKQENEAEIALDVTKAKRERAEAEYAEKLNLKKECERNELSKRKIRREKLSSFYYKASLLFCN